ncbi:hypothetical protein ABE504_04995 [Paenibacillus oryzisoli]|uniref:hypothetical protein n=1 Tax=Paenibacillus oryzisoli TaxID=1850517 RepID=UPI003D29E3CD
MLITSLSLVLALGLTACGNGNGGNAAEGKGDGKTGRLGGQDQNVVDRSYTAGIMLLDLEDPRKVIGMSRQPLLASEHR